MHVLQGFSALQTLKIISLEQPELRIIVPAIPQILPNLSHIDLPVYHSHVAPLDKFIDNVQGLSSIRLDLRSNEHLLGKVLAKFSGALTRLHLGLVTMSQFFSVVASCSVLQELIVGNLVIMDSEQTAVSPCWIACLRKFVVWIQYRMNHNIDPVPEYVLERQFAQFVAPSFMEQLGSLEMLQELSISRIIAPLRTSIDLISLVSTGKSVCGGMRSTRKGISLMDLGGNSLILPLSQEKKCRTNRIVYDIIFSLMRASLWM